LPEVITNSVVPLAPASVNVTLGVPPVQFVFKEVSEPVPESLVGEYVGVRSDGPESVMLHEALIVVDTLKVSGIASAPAETAATSAAPATRAVQVRVRVVKVTGYQTFPIIKE
jgi:hypothetical protein